MFCIMFFSLTNNYTDRVLHGHLIGTASPIFLLVRVIAIPSIKILYLRNDIHSMSLASKSL